MMSCMGFAVAPGVGLGELSTVDALARLRRAAPLPVAVAAVVVLVVGGGITVALISDTDRPYQVLAMVGLGLATANCAALGALVVASRPGHRLGLALLLGGVLGAVWMFATTWDGDPGTTRPLNDWAAWLENWSFVGLIALVTWPLLLFPDGRLPSRRWRPIGWLLALALLTIALTGMLDAATLDGVDGHVTNPLGIPAGWSWIQQFNNIGIVLPLAVVAGMVAVNRRARGTQDVSVRAALWASRLLAANFVLCLMLNLTQSPLADGAFYAVTLTTSVGLFAVASTSVVLRNRAVEVDVLLRRAFIVAGVTVGSLLVFAAAFAVVRAVAGESSGALGGALAVVLVAVPLRVGVREQVDRALYGHRDPSVAVQRFSEQLDGARDPAAALLGIAQALRDTFGASSVSIRPSGEVTLRAVQTGSASAAAPELDIELVHRGRQLGRLIIGARAAGESYGAHDLVLSQLLARQLGLVLETLDMASALQQSREAIVTAREEERRRLRRELHDGLGSALAGIALTLQAARNTDGADADRLVEDAREQTQYAVVDVRRMVRGLRPPVLEDLGLAAALQAHADRMSPLSVALDLEDLTEPMPAATELALYRIATEALTNVVRHSNARRCQVRARRGADEVVLEVSDDGQGLNDPSVPGVGLRSMNERAAELGGRVALHDNSSGGLTVRVNLPLTSTGAK